MVENNILLLCPKRSGLKSGQLIIPSPTLAALGKPSFVTMMMNLEKNTMLLVAANFKHYAMRLIPDDGGSCTIPLDMAEMKICHLLGDSHSGAYLLTGQPTHVERRKAVLFKLDQARRLSDEEVNEYGHG